MLLANLLLCALLVWIAATARRYESDFYWVFAATTIYYGVGGLWYWGTYRQGYFLGVYWGSEVQYAAFLLCASSLFVVILARTLKYRSRGMFVVPEQVDVRQILLPPLFKKLFIIGMIGTCYVLFSVLFLGGLNRTSDSFILVAYQFSDLLIPVIIFLLATRGYRGWVLLLIVFYTCYGMAVGFRYRLFLFLVPIVIGEIRSYGRLGRSGGVRRFAKLAVGFVLGGGLLWLFSFMTAARRKFSGIDFATAGFSTFDSKLYGLFSETNTLFGLVSAIRKYLDPQDVNYIYLIPFRDAILELIPKFLVPWRNTGQYYQTVAEGLVTDQAANSGTTYPFVGEYILMFGYIGIVLGCICYASLYAYFARSVARNSGGLRPLHGYGSALLAAFFGYYFYSRGYIPQVVKGVLFVVVPYIALLRSYKRSLAAARDSEAAENSAFVPPVRRPLPRRPVGG